MRLKRTLCSAASLAAVVAGTVLATPANASPATHHRSPDLQLLDASASWVVYAVDEEVYVRSVHGGKPIDVHGYSDSDGQEIAGNFLIYSRARAEDGHRRYVNLRTGATGKVAAKWQTATPDGGAWTAVDKTDGKTHGYSQDAASGAVTDLGVLPGFDHPRFTDTGATQGDEHGILFEQSNYANGRTRADYVSFDRPGHVTQLDMRGVGYYAYCSLASNALGCADTYLDLSPSRPSNSQVVRIPLTGHSQQKAIEVTMPALPSRARPYIAPALTSTRTAWTFGLDPTDSYDGPEPSFRVHSVPANAPGGQRRSSDFQVSDPSFMVTGGDRIYVAHDGKARTAGIYTVSANGRSQKLFLHV